MHKAYARIVTLLQKLKQRKNSLDPGTVEIPTIFFNKGFPFFREPEVIVGNRNAILCLLTRQLGRLQIACSEKFKDKVVIVIPTEHFMKLVVKDYTVLLDKNCKLDGIGGQVVTDHNDLTSNFDT